tara:strand:- start:3582 stop:4274 length:693 start_codon:yes stop_codon:yes gene_type:complete
MKRIFARGGIEFIAVLLGFSLSLYFDNLNEINQKKENEKNLLSDLKVSLEQDIVSAELISKRIDTCFKSQNMLFVSDCENLNSLSADSLKNLLFLTGRGAISFFPRYGVYRSLVSNSDMKYLKSNDLKEKIINLYDYAYKRYENMDIVMENLYQYDYNDFLVENFNVGTLDDSSYYQQNMTLNINFMCSSDFKKKIRYLNGMTRSVKNTLDEILSLMKEVDELIFDELKS